MAHLKNTLFSKLRNTTSSLVKDLKQKARSRTALGLAMLFTTQALSSSTSKVYADPTNGKSIAKNNVDAAKRFIKVSYGENYTPGKDAALDRIVASGDIVEGIQELKGKPLDVDSLYKKTLEDETQKEKLFRAAYQKVREQALPDTVDNERNVTLAAPVGDSFDNILVRSTVKMRKTRWDKHKVQHKGLDLMVADKYGRKIPNQVGLKVRAVADGVITHSGITTRGRTGNIQIESGNLKFSYMHVKTLKEMRSDLKVGDSIKAGDVLSEIAPIRRGERSEAPHLHLETYLNGKLQVACANSMVEKEGFIGQLTDSKFTKEIGWYMQAQLLKDNDGESFEAIPEKLDTMVAKGKAQLARKSSKRRAATSRKLIDTYNFRMNKYDMVSQVIEQEQKQVFAAQHQAEEEKMAVALQQIEAPEFFKNYNADLIKPKSQMAAVSDAMFKDTKKEIANTNQRYVSSSTGPSPRWTYTVA
jgi:murein DD-endopeptidase MepM/ murein hydrolase activator NlpD